MRREIEKAIVEASHIYPAYQQKPYLDGGIFGYNLAVDKACSWLLEWETHQGEDIEIVEQFRKAMKGE